MLLRQAAVAAAGVMAVAAVTPTLGRATKAAIGDFGIDLHGRDTGVKPGDDFWSYANGSWAKRTKIPADRASAGQLDVLGDKAEADVHSILVDIAANPSEFGPEGDQLGDFYASWMDTVALEAKGVTPLKPYLDRIAIVTSKQDLQVLFATTGYTAPIGLDVMPGPSNPKRYAAVASQGELGMPRNNYLLSGTKNNALRAAYRAYVQQIQELAGVPDAARKADAIVALETAMANAQWAPEQLRDFAAINKPMDRLGMMALAPEVDWDIMLRTAHLEKSITVMMAGDTAIVGLARLLDSVPLETWKDWITFQFINTHASYLNKAMDDARFQFYSTISNGVLIQPDRWRRGVQLLNGAMGDAVGKYYVERFFPRASEAAMQDLFANLRSSLKESLRANLWMDEQTRDRALIKLSAFEPRIGHPVRYIDYSSLRIMRDDLLGNVVRANEFKRQLQLSRLDKPVDRTLWDMTPQTVNAYYNPLTNQITFPAAFLQPPFFDPNADPAVNYGAIGAVIGHEMGHGFDDQGSKFGPDGTFGDWWTPAARKTFTDRTARLVEQYDGYKPLPGVKINGKLTLGENIGDLNGVLTAYSAYQRYLKDHGPAKVLDGLTGDQRFFLSYAQVWREIIRKDAMRQLLLSNPHSPGKFRVNGVVRNIDAWYKAFDIQSHDKLYLTPVRRVRLW